MKRLALGALTVLLAAPAGAQEAKWTGFYLGAHGGYGWADIDYPGAAPHPAGPPRPELDGGFLGGQLGYNVQLGSFVIGAEADLSFASLDATERDGNSITQSYELEKFGSVRARAGFAFDNFLPYVTGGWAWADQSFNQTCPDPASQPYGHCRPAAGFAPYSNTASETLNGWAYGGGVEYRISDRWSVKAEYLHYDFDSKDFVLGPSSGTGKDLGSKELETDFDTFRLGVNIKLF